MVCELKSKNIFTTAKHKVLVTTLRLTQYIIIPPLLEKLQEL